MGTLRSFWRILNYQTLAVTVIAIVSTHICWKYDFTADFPLTLLGVAVVFPLVFSISGAYKRREAALDDYGSLKAHGRAMFFAARDWIPEKDAESQKRILVLLGDLLAACRDLFMTPLEHMEQKEARVYGVFSDISIFIHGLRAKGLPSGEASRCNQFLSKMIVSFESVKHIYQYRTPRTLRAYSQVFIYLLPIIYGPYFASIGQDVTFGLRYFMPILFSVVLVSLDNIQDQLENPFDQIGEDDIMINAEKFVEGLESVADRE